MAGELEAAREELQTAEEELRLQNEALAEADRLKSALLSVVSHDLKTPLAAIKASISHLRRRLAAVPLPEGTAEALAGIEEEADQLNALVSALLDLSRLESGAWQPVRDWYELSDILGAVLARFRDDAAARIHALLPEDLPMMHVDGVQIAQVLWNLLDNALKYSPPDTAIEVSATLEMGNGGVRVTVADQGPGVPASERQLIFASFYRGEQGTTGKGPPRTEIPGSGLGLAVCRGLVEAHGGRIWVEERLPRGAAFQFTLPAAGPGPPASCFESEFCVETRHDPPHPRRR